MAISRQALAKPVSVKIGDGKSILQEPAFTEPVYSLCYGPQSHYTAIFCKLEFLSMEATHVWFKIHAGDYDSYSRKRW